MRTLLGLAALLAPSLALAQPGAEPAAEPDPAAADPAAAAPAEVAPPVRVAAIPATPVASPGTAPLPDRQAAAAPPAQVGIGKRMDQDAAAGRAFFTETALMSPGGYLGLDLRMPTAPLANLGLRYAVTDRIEIGVSGLTIAEEDDVALGVQAKAQIWHNDRAAIAVGVQRYTTTSDSDEGLTIPTVVATTCLDGADCLAMVSVSLNGLIIDSESSVPVFAGASWALGRKVQFVGELHLSNDDSNSFTFGYFGLRGASHSFSFDAGIGFASEGDDCLDCSSEDAAFPFVGVATRM